MRSTPGFVWSSLVHVPVLLLLMPALACDVSSSAAGAGGANGGSASGGTAGAEAAAGAGGSGGSGEEADGGGGAGATTLHIAWDWTGVIGTGQSLAVGDPGSGRGTPAARVRATTQPYANLKLSTGALAWPIDPSDSSLALVPLIEPVGRLATAYPSSWPTNISGETPHAAMASQITSLAREAGGVDLVSVHGEVGENGQCLSYLMRGATPNGVNGRSESRNSKSVRAVRTFPELT